LPAHFCRAAALFLATRSVPMRKRRLPTCTSARSLYDSTIIFL
jgi:hypothetical protein